MYYEPNSLIENDLFRELSRYKRRIKDFAEGKSKQTKQKPQNKPVKQKP